MRRGEGAPPLLAASLERSLGVVRAADALAYFVNAADLVRGGRIRREKWEGLLERLDWLASRLRPPREITVFVSRLDEAAFEDARPSLSAILGDGARQEAALRRIASLEEADDDRRRDKEDDDDALDDLTRSVRDAEAADARGTLLTRTLAALLHESRGAGLCRGGVRCARHVRPGHARRSAVDVPGLVALLLALFRRRGLALLSGNPRDEASAPVAREIARCCAVAATTTVDEASYDPWVDAAAFAAHLSGQGAFAVGAPQTLLVDRFDVVAASMARRGLLVDAKTRVAVAVDLVTRGGRRQARGVFGPRGRQASPPSPPPPPAAAGCCLVQGAAAAAAPTAAQARVRAPLSAPFRLFVQRVVDHGETDPVTSPPSSPISMGPGIVVGEEDGVPGPLLAELEAALLALREALCKTVLGGDTEEARPLPAPPPPLPCHPPRKKAQALWLAADLWALETLKAPPGVPRPRLVLLESDVDPDAAADLQKLVASLGEEGALADGACCNLRFTVRDAAA